MHALLTIPNTKSMVKINTIVYFVTKLHTCLHAEPDKTFSHIKEYIILHHKTATVSQLCRQQNRKRHYLHILS